jgi:hypothetical protein
MYSVVTAVLVVAALIAVGVFVMRRRSRAAPTTPAPTATMASPSYGEVPRRQYATTGSDQPEFDSARNSNRDHYSSMQAVVGAYSASASDATPPTSLHNAHALPDAPTSVYNKVCKVHHHCHDIVAQMDMKDDIAQDNRIV